MSIKFKGYVEDVDKYDRIKVIYMNSEDRELMLSMKTMYQIPAYNNFCFIKRGRILESNEVIIANSYCFECSITKWVYNGKTGNHLTGINIQPI